MNSAIAQEVAHILLDIGAISFHCSRPFKYTSGILSPIYSDNRLLMGHPDKRKKIIAYFLEVIKNNNIECDMIAGVATAGIPFAAWIADQLDKPLIYIRTTRKDHGKENVIEGDLKSGQQTIVIEDHISTGGSSANAVETARKCKLDVKYCISISTYDMVKAKKIFQKIDCISLSLTNLTTLIKVAQENKNITKEEADKILEWNDDPQGWGEKDGI